MQLLNRQVVTGPKDDVVDAAAEVLREIIETGNVKPRMVGTAAIVRHDIPPEAGVETLVQIIDTGPRGAEFVGS